MPPPATPASPRSAAAIPCARRTARASSPWPGHWKQTSSSSGRRRPSSPASQMSSGMSVCPCSGRAPEPPGSRDRSRSRRTSCKRRAFRLPESLSIARPPCVIKADGLAAGKGVFVCHDQAELDVALQAAASFGESIVIEELLEGEEVSVFALCDGAHALALPVVQDFKRAEDGDSGPEHGRDGVVLTGSRLRRGGGRGNTGHGPSARARGARGTRRSLRRRPLRRAHAHRRRAARPRVQLPFR